VCCVCCACVCCVCRVCCVCVFALCLSVCMCCVCYSCCARQKAVTTQLRCVTPPCSRRWTSFAARWVEINPSCTANCVCGIGVLCVGVCVCVCVVCVLCACHCVRVVCVSPCVWCVVFWSCLHVCCVSMKSYVYLSRIRNFSLNSLISHE